MSDNEIEQIKMRLDILEKSVFGMTHEEADALVNNYIEAMKERPDTKATSEILKAENVLGV